MSQTADRHEQARLAADLRAGGKTWVEIADALRRRWSLRPRAALRLAHGWSQDRAAAEWNRRWPDDLKTFKNFSYWETWPDSGYAPPLRVLQRLARLYECTVADLVTDLGDYRYLDDPRMEPGHGSDPWEAVARTLARVGDPANEVPDGEHQDVTTGFEARLRRAWTRTKAGSQRPSLILVAGFAGSGKTEFGRFLSHVSGWAHLDKDTVTRPLAEGTLVALGGDPNDRHTSVYRDKVRPLEYRCLMEAAFANLERGISTVATAPFLTEVADDHWVRRLRNTIEGLGAELTVVWVDTDVDSMHEHLQRRGAARDTWKLTCWDEYLASIDLELRPFGEHLVVDNRLNAAVGLAERARDLVERADR